MNDKFVKNGLLIISPDMFTVPLYYREEQVGTANIRCIDNSFTVICDFLDPANKVLEEASELSVWVNYDPKLKCNRPYQATIIDPLRELRKSNEAQH